MRIGRCRDSSDSFGGRRWAWALVFSVPAAVLLQLPAEEQKAKIVNAVRDEYRNEPSVLLLQTRGSISLVEVRDMDTPK